MAAQNASKPQREQIRRRVVAIALLCLVAIIGAGTTLTFTSQRAGAENVLSFKNAKLEILETELVGEQEVPVQEDDPVRADKGKISRIVRVGNAGTADIYVRVRPVMVAKTAEGQETVGPEVDEHVEYVLNTGDSANQWTYNPEDGWYYYNSSIAPEGTTAEFMTALEFNGDYYTLTGSGGTFEMTIDAQGVQSENNVSPDGKAINATGWPSTNEAGE